jgi:hypothetical protein
MLPMTDTNITALDVQIHILKQQIELEESNYKYAVELNKDFEILLMLTQHIIEQKKILYALIKNSAKEKKLE